MPSWVNKILGINWRTSLAAWATIMAAVGRIAVAYRTRDFQAIFTDSQLIFETIGLLLVAFGLMKAKDQNVTGTGTTAKAVDSSGTITNREGEVIGQQPEP
jgi:hypothetical protein